LNCFETVGGEVSCAMVNPDFSRIPVVIESTTGRHVVAWL